ncbi:hypothetical protein P4S63_25820 [Pseudoalteromonas sp. B193]
MCADCHSDNLKRNYTTEKESFDTHFSNINVGCKSCHSDITDEHKTKNNKDSSNKPYQYVAVENNWR